MNPSQRAAVLFLQRWDEQLATTFPPRRARTLSACSALDELLALAESWLRSGGHIRPAVDAEAGGHGVAMLPDLAAEAEHVLSEDPLLAARHAQRRDILVAVTKRLKGEKPDDIALRDAIGQMQAIIPTLKHGYVAVAFDEVLRLLEAEPSAHERLLRLSSSLISELRSRGWTDTGLLEASAAVTRCAEGDPIRALELLRGSVTGSQRPFVCYVCLTLPTDRPSFPQDEAGFSLIETLPAGARSGRALKKGSYVQVKVEAFDPTGAAIQAHRRVLSTVGALTVFLAASRIDVSSEVVGVLGDGGELRGCEVQERLPEEKRHLSREEGRRILMASWKASSRSAADPLQDAIRLRHRALLAQDPESRLLLLWSGLERLTAGARGFRAALSAARELVSHAVAFGKLRRDVGDLTAVIEHAGGRNRQLLAELQPLVGGFRSGAANAGPDRIDRRKVLDLLLGDEAMLKTLTATLYECEPLLAFRCHELWSALGRGNAANRGKDVARYHEDSRRRVAWQIGRIYRARNQIAHVGLGPERLRDLVVHAHFYLTQSVAICVHYTKRDPICAQEILSRRMGQYQAFIELLRRGDPTCVTGEVLLRPSLAVGEEAT